MDLVGWGLGALAVSALVGILVIGRLGEIALRRCPEGDIPVVLERITKMFGVFGKGVARVGAKLQAARSTVPSPAALEESTAREGS